MLSVVSVLSTLAAMSSTFSTVTFVAEVVGDIVAGIVLYLLVCRYSARHLPEVRAEEASELLKKLSRQQAGLVCSLSIGIMVGFVFPAISHLSAGSLPLVVHLMDTTVVSVSIIGVTQPPPRLHAVQSAVAARAGCLAAPRAVKTMDNDVRNLHEACGSTQARLEVALGASGQSINSIEKDKYDPSLPLATAIARHFKAAAEGIFHVRIRAHATYTAHAHPFLRCGRRFTLPGLDVKCSGKPEDHQTAAVHYQEHGLRCRRRRPSVGGCVSNPDAQWLSLWWRQRSVSRNARVHRPDRRQGTRI